MGNRPSSPVPAVAGGGRYDLAILFSHYGNDILVIKLHYIRIISLRFWYIKKDNDK